MCHLSMYRTLELELTHRAWGIGDKARELGLVCDQPKEFSWKCSITNGFFEKDRNVYLWPYRNSLVLKRLTLVPGF